jgi:hypothetical protein
MIQFRIIAQHMTGTKRIAKVVSARTADEALRLVARELHEANYYALQAMKV